MKQRSPMFAAAITVLLITSWSQADEPLQYNRDVRPILSAHCFSCHGPDSEGRQADLRLDEREAAIESVIAPGKPDESELIRRILSQDHDEVMPPTEFKKPLTQTQREILVRWVKEGAEYAKHWSFIAPEKPPLPTTQASNWAHNPIDHFVLSKLEAAGLHPSAEADRATLVRRVSYDLNGLPPTLTDLDRFVSDTSPNWYEKMVDHYMSQPAFGERMALAWLDASRYGDTSVFHADGPRDMWPWRDWVIQAYNSNMPFDQFTIEQLAGDLLPNATPLQQVASGFNRNHATTDEGGAIAEEWRIDYVVDRVKTTSNVWLGISMECGQCHRHKFDPISHKEYYQFFAFFNQTKDPGMQTRKGNQTPLVTVPNLLQEAHVASLERQLKDLDAKIEDRIAKADTPYNNWLTEVSEKAKDGDIDTAPMDMLVHFSFDEKEGNQVTDSIANHTGEIKGKVERVDGKFARALKLDGGNFVEAGELGDFDRTDGFSYGCWVNPEGNPNGVPIGKMDEGQAFRGWDLFITGGNVAVHVINSWPQNAIKVTTKAKIPSGKWSHVFATYDGSGKASGVKIYFDGKSQPWNVNEDRLTATTKTKVPLKIGRRNTTSPFKGLVDDVRIYERTLNDAEVAALAGSDPLAPILALDEEKRTDDQLKKLRVHFLSSFDDPYKKLVAERKNLKNRIETEQKKVTTCMVMGEQEKPRDTFVLMRGHYASPDKSEVIKPGVPAVLPPLPEGAPPNRLGLAQWLVSDAHPLTARVTVNRYWSMIFGRGIVATPMDFGSQGAWPTHPELLDYLAVDFRESGWDIKRMWKQILMSSTYRQSSKLTQTLAEKDPENLLLARSPRYRLQGEMIRDSALLVSGLLVDQVGGPGVKPYQPPGLWNEVALSGNVRFVQDKGEKIYRKSMYIYWKRSSPHPGMRIFDAPTREKCVVQRPRTNTPLQALYTLNDVQFVESARALAQRMMKEGGDMPEQRIRFAYRQLTSRDPSSRTERVLLQLLETEKAHYAGDTKAANELLSVGDGVRDATLDPVEHAAWTVVANVLLNLDVSLTRY